MCLIHSSPRWTALLETAHIFSTMTEQQEPHRARSKHTVTRLKSRGAGYFLIYLELRQASATPASALWFLCRAGCRPSWEKKRQIKKIFLHQTLDICSKQADIQVKQQLSYTCLHMGFRKNMFYVVIPTLCDNCMGISKKQPLDSAFGHRWQWFISWSNATTLPSVNESHPTVLHLILSSDSDGDFQTTGAGCMGIICVCGGVCAYVWAAINNSGVKKRKVTVIDVLWAAALIK